MWTQFYLENIHFAINLFAALTFFAVGYLYFDAWYGRRSQKELLRAFGFLLLSLSFVLHGIGLETPLLPQTLLNNQLTETLYLGSHLGGYLFVIISLLKDRLQPKPKTPGLVKEDYSLPALAVSNLMLLQINKFEISNLMILAPFMALLTAILYLRRAYWGLEHHLRLIGLSFMVLAANEFLASASLLRNTSSVDLYNLVAPFGPIWDLEQISLLLAIIILGKWVFGYLLKQLQTQLMMIFCSTVLIIFLITTVTFTALLVNDLKQETLKQLQTNTKVLDLTLQGKAGQNLSDGEVLAQDPNIKNAILNKNAKLLSNSAQNFLVAKKLSSVIILNQDGQVLARGEDPARVGDSLSGDIMVKKALLNHSTNSVVLHQGVIAPQLTQISALPVTDNTNKSIGVVIIATAIDNQFIDHIKNVSNLEASIYGQDNLAATTLTLTDNKTRAIGTKFSDPKITNQVLKNGQSYLGETNILNQSYFISLLPLKDVNNIPVGMLAVGQLQTGTLLAAGRSIELTFLVSAILLMLSILPAAVISRQIAEQLH